MNKLENLCKYLSKALKKKFIGFTGNWFKINNLY